MKRSFRYKYSKWVLFLFSCLMMQYACKKDEVKTDEELVPFFELFAEEAGARGIVVNYEEERIEGLIQNITTPNVLGQCFRNESKPRKVIIDRSSWEDLDYYGRVFLIFHELGHCFLNREHLDTSEPRSRTCTSIMHSSPSACNFELTDDNKEEYFDELFSN